MARVGEVISHWHHSVENFNTSTLEFYSGLEAALREKEAPSVSTSRLDWNETGIFSAKREYLRVAFGRFSFDICAAPFGKDYFFSWWLTKRQPEASLFMGCGVVIGLFVLFVILVNAFGIIIGFIASMLALGGVIMLASNSGTSGSDVFEDMIVSIPVLGSLYKRFVRPVTYFSEDTRLIFEESVHRVVVSHVGALLTVANLPPLTPEQIKAHSRAV